jgi:hypothetical protein
MISTADKHPNSDEADALSDDVAQVSSTIDSLRRKNAASRARIEELANALAYVHAAIDPEGSGAVADCGLDSHDLQRIWSTVSLLRKGGATIRLHNEELEEGLGLLYLLIVGDDGIQPVNRGSKVESIVSIYSRLQEDHAERGGGIRELEGSMQLLRSSVLENNDEAFGCASDVTEVSPIVVSHWAKKDGQGSLIAELEATIMFLWSYIADGDDGGPIIYAADVCRISSVVLARWLRVPRRREF